LPVSGPPWPANILGGRPQNPAFFPQRRASSTYSNGSCSPSKTPVGNHHHQFLPGKPTWPPSGRLIARNFSIPSTGEASGRVPNVLACSASPEVPTAWCLFTFAGCQPLPLFFSLGLPTLCHQHARNMMTSGRRRREGLGVANFACAGKRPRTSRVSFQPEENSIFFAFE